MSSPAEPPSTEHDGARRSMALVMNAKAGTLLGEGGGGSLRELLERQASELHVVDEGAGTLPERVALAQDAGSACIVVAGGDGTVACAAQALTGTDAVLGVIPGGTMNLLARDLGLDPDDREAAVRTLGQGRVRAIDVGEVADRDGAPHRFLCASMIGTPARLSRHREAGRERGNGPLAWAAFAWAALRALVRNRSMRLVLRHDGAERTVRTPSLTVTVNRLDDESGRIFGRSCLDGGRLAVYVVRRDSVAGQLRLLLRTAWSGSMRAPQIEVIDTDAIEISNRHAAIHVLVDGERRLLRPPLRYTIRPGALRVMAPHDPPPAGGAPA